MSDELRDSLPSVEVPGLYVHVPFCFHKCHYCDFYSITRQTPERMGRYVDLVLAEAAYWSAGPIVTKPKTIFFGGGTPTLLPLEEMRRLLRGLRQRFDFSEVNEWTVEANPATLSGEYAAMLRSEGVDRISFGAQSFDRKELACLERHHDPEDVPRSAELARAAGFRRVNLDLIYAIPGQSLQSWEKSLGEVMGLNPEHISCYGLTYEPNTPIAVKKRLGQIRAAEEDVELAMLHVARRRLGEGGWGAYEISNYAKAGEECKHNLLYWKGLDYLGLGPSAASHVQGWRWKNRPHLGEWEAAVGQNGVPAGEIEHLDRRRRAGELAWLSLRLAQGIDFAEFKDRSGYDAEAIFARPMGELLKLGLIERTGRGVRLSDRGLNVADAVGGEFLGAS